MIVMSATALAAAVGCSAQAAPQRQPATTQLVPATVSQSSAFPRPTASIAVELPPRPEVCKRPGEHRVPRPEVLIISRVSLDGGRVVLSARPSILVCGPKVENDGYHLPASGAARTYRLAPQATVVLMDMSDGPVPAQYTADGFVALLRTKSRPSLERGGLDPYFRSFRTALVASADGTEITTLAQLYSP
ncbi:hypothetical protein [Nonomuraea sp. NPDC049141]|uniref:hypothetical protein n=1 Tax=Nonomuraea sp. NPDC049141 TaxID=3155500 RepID=UPI003405CBCA